MDFLWFPTLAYGCPIPPEGIPIICVWLSVAFIWFHLVPYGFLCLRSVSCDLIWCCSDFVPLFSDDVQSAADDVQSVAYAIRWCAYAFNVFPMIVYGCLGHILVSLRLRIVCVRFRGVCYDFTLCSFDCIWFLYFNVAFSYDVCLVSD